MKSTQRAQSSSSAVSVSVALVSCSPQSVCYRLMMEDRFPQIRVTDTAIATRVPMKFEEIITGLRTLHPSDFDYSNMEARGWERLSELTDALMGLPGGH